MFSLKNKYIVILISFIWFYLIYKVNHLHNNINYYWFPITLFIFGGWVILFNHRLFVMTRKKLSENFYLEQKLEYKPLIKNNIVERIYVKPQGTDNWYEIDYTLTIPQNCLPHVYNNFVVNNSTVRRLLKTMNENANDNITKKRIFTNENRI